MVQPQRHQGKARMFVRGITSKRRPRRDSVENDIEARASTYADNVPDITLDDTNTTLDGKRYSLSHDDRPPRAYWKKTLWEDVRVGEFVKIMNESIPADILICATSEEDNVAYVETKNLDGETNLKSRDALQILTDLRAAADCAGKQRFSCRMRSPGY